MPTLNSAFAFFRTILLVFVFFPILAIARETINKVGITMVDVPAGNFLMGSCRLTDAMRDMMNMSSCLSKPYIANCSNPEEVVGEEQLPQYQVSVKAFQLGQTEITLGQFKKFVEAKGRHDLMDSGFLKFNVYGDDAPVWGVSWHAAQDFVAWLNEIIGSGYRLPSEAEWEYACRAGGLHTYCGGNSADEVAWFYGNSDGHLHPVKQKLPNAWGLYDMSGNVNEWVQDCWHDNYLGAPIDGSAWESNCKGSLRVLRGGRWSDSDDWGIRAGHRASMPPHSALHGFRVARTAPTLPENIDRKLPPLPVSNSQEFIKAAQVKSKSVPKTFKDCADCPDMAVIPAGKFEMGSRHCDSSPEENPVHQVTIGSAFAIGRTEVTQKQWKAVMGNNPSNAQVCGDLCPVEQVSWLEAHEFIRRLNAKTGKLYRLPSEAEWEYACRAGTDHPYCGGDNINVVAWYGDARTGPFRVAQKTSNAWGVYDMSGNVSEWVEDCWHDNYNGAPNDGSAWTWDCSFPKRVVRGGNWIFTPRFARSNARSPAHESGSDLHTGFRVVRMLSGNE